MSSGWRRLGWFWLAVLLVLATGAVVLQVLGPPAPRRIAAPAPASAPPTAAANSKPPPLVSEVRGPPPATRPGRDTPGPIADPDPSLVEQGPGGTLPQVAEDGRMPMQVYAAGFDRSSRRPRIGLVVAGVGLDGTASAAAIRELPRGVTLAISPYALNPQKLLEAARFAEHEYLLSLPMEPESFPLNDPGPHALMTNLPEPENLQRLNWLLSRIQGYVGVTSALGTHLQGERIAAVPEQMMPVLQELAKRGLLYVDARPGQARLPYVWNRDVDLVVDQPVTGIEGKLAELERIAHDKGSALGLALEPRPVTVQRIAAWGNRLLDRGFVLAPVSALAGEPAETAKQREANAKPAEAEKPKP